MNIKVNMNDIITANIQNPVAIAVATNKNGTNKIKVISNGMLNTMLKTNNNIKINIRVSVVEPVVNVEKLPMACPILLL